MRNSLKSLICDVGPVPQGGTGLAVPSRLAGEAALLIGTLPQGWAGVVELCL